MIFHEFKGPQGHTAGPTPDTMQLTFPYVLRLGAGQCPQSAPLRDLVQVAAYLHQGAQASSWQTSNLNAWTLRAGLRKLCEAGDSRQHQGSPSPLHLQSMLCALNIQKQFMLLLYV